MSTVDEQIKFAWHNFEDQQAIIRAADLKAGYLVPFLLFFGASTIPLGSEVVPKMKWGDSTGALAALLYIASYALLTVGFVWSLALNSFSTPVPFHWKLKNAFFTFSASSGLRFHT